MKFYGADLAEGSTITNITVPSGTSFPVSDNVGELFYRTDEDKLYIRDNSTWIATLVGAENDAVKLQGNNGAYYLDVGNATGILEGGTF